MFLAGLGIFFLKLVNVLRKGDYYENRYVLVTFVGSLLSWGTVFLGTLYKHTLEYSIVFNLANAILLMSVMLTILEVVLMFRSVADYAAKGRKMSDFYRRR